MSAERNQLARLPAITLALALAAGGLGVAEEPPPEPPKPSPEPEKPAEPVDVPEPTGSRLPRAVMQPGAEPGGPGGDDLREVALAPVKAESAWREPAEFLLQGPPDFLKDAKGRYVLRDASGRELCRGILKVSELAVGDDGARRFQVPTARAIVPGHTLELTLLGADDRRLERSCAFRLRRPPGEWDGWRTLLHAPYGGGGRWEALAGLGVHGGLAYRLNAERAAALRAAGAPFYVENVARQFLSRYQSERGLWEKTLARAASDPEGRVPLMREPSLCALEAAQGYVKELERHAAEYRRDEPLFYSLAAEPSVTRLAAPFDFDFHPEALAEFRRWLERDVYGTLTALNGAWGASYRKWEEVEPITTREALRRLEAGQWSFGPWVDFRAFQDHSFAKVLQEGGRLLRASDPRARAGITGALGPAAFGGWDWARLAKALDVVEAYDIGGARELWRDLAPGKPALAVVPLARDPRQTASAPRALWSLALDGGPRGALLWDEQPGEGGAARVLLNPDGQPSPAAELLAPALRELGGPLGRLLARARRERASVGLLYSPASVRVHWLLEAGRLHPADWLKAWGGNPAAERSESSQLRLRLSWTKLLADLGLPWRFVSSAEVEAGRISVKESGLRVLVLPRAAALSNIEVEVLKAYVAEGGVLVADSTCGRFDEHGSARERPALDVLFGLDTSREPFAAEPPHPLEALREVAEPGAPAAEVEAAALGAPPPVFSDKPAWAGVPPRRRLEYRGSPVMVKRAVTEGAAVYLNLDLEPYLNWRLHPEVPRAARVRGAVARLVFSGVLQALPEDLEASALPPGTEIVRLTLGAGPGGARLLALRRNGQERLREVGREGETEDAFLQVAPYKLALRAKAWVADLRSGRPAQQTQVVEGTLDPLTPALLTLSAAQPLSPDVQAPATVKAGGDVTLRVALAKGGEAGARLYVIEVKDPDGVARTSYGGVVWAPEGGLEFQVPLAINDAPGEWRTVVRDLTAGVEAVRTVKVLPGE